MITLTEQPEAATPENSLVDLWPRVALGGIPTDLLRLNRALDVIATYAEGNHSAQLAVVSANLDHIHYFGRDAGWLSRHPARQPDEPRPTEQTGRQLHWLTLLDGAPLVTKAGKLTGSRWPRLSGSDIIGPIIQLATLTGWRIGFLGGTSETHARLQHTLPADHPGLIVSGYWAPARSVLSDSAQSNALAAEIAAADTDILVVGLGKPRQEIWIEQFGSQTNASVLLAFGAVVDFLAGSVRRAPQWVADNGWEWAWRLSQEPKRLARRYLIQGPPSYVHMQRNSHRLPPTFLRSRPEMSIPRDHEQIRPATFVLPDSWADISVVVVTYNSSDDIGTLLAGLRAEAARLRLRVIVCDNGSSDDTVAQLRVHDDVITLATGVNAGYAGGINRALDRLGPCGSVLILNPDVRLESGALENMMTRLRQPGVGVVVPKIVDDEGQTYPSLRREPTVFRALGDAAFGRRLPGRPALLSEIDHQMDHYATARPTDWATGAAMLIDRTVSDQIGPWNEDFFLYSEETDYCRRVRDAGYQVWYEPQAVVQHHGGGSGTSPDLEALLSVNKLRYAEFNMGRLRASAFRLAIALSEIARSSDPVHRRTLGFVVNRDRWPELPEATERARDLTTTHRGSVIIPAHNEEAVIARTLQPLSAAAVAGVLEVVVICNGCGDKTADAARSIPGIQVVEIAEASKVAALNTGDSRARQWPRLYLDADIEPSLEAVLDVLDELSIGEHLAARPTFRYETAGSSIFVRSYYRARNRIPELHQALWGAGAYAMTERGHQRFGTFPQVTGDDLFVDAQFGATEKTVVDSTPLTVRIPRRLPDLLAVLRRVNTGNQQAATTSDATRAPVEATTSKTFRSLLTSVRGPRSLLDASVYAGIATWGHLASRRRQRSGWERDDSSRERTTPTAPSGPNLD